MKNPTVILLCLLPVLLSAQIGFKDYGKTVQINDSTQVTKGQTIELAAPTAGKEYAYVFTIATVWYPETQQAPAMLRGSKFEVEKIVAGKNTGPHLVGRVNGIRYMINTLAAFESGEVKAGG